MADGDDADLLRTLRGEALETLVAGAKLAHAVKTAAPQALSEDMLFGMARLHLSFYSDLLRLVTGHLDRAAEGLRAMRPAPGPTAHVYHVAAAGSSGGEAVGEFAVANPGVDNAAVQFESLGFTGAADYIADAALTFDPESGSKIPAGQEQTFKITIDLDPARRFAPGQYRGEIAISLNRRPAGLVVVTLRVEASAQGI